jgi:sugar transferase EpsL
MTEATRTWSRMTKLIKRVFDVCFSLFAIALLSPVLLAVAISVWATMGRPIFFRQVRAGRDAVRLRVWKFRTMTNARDQSGNLLPDEERQTRLGTFLRRWSLDELPQFFNVLGGGMSVVGPRPLSYRYISRYSERQALRQTVKPGITGLAQVSGRRALDWQSRFELDVLYVEESSLWLDLKLILATVAKIFRREDVERPEESEFWGNGVQGPPGVRYRPMDEDEAPSSPATPAVGKSA